MYTDDPQKDPSDILDYKTDFTAVLASGELIASVAVTAATGINLHDGATTYDGVVKAAPLSTDTDTSVTFWLSGGTLMQNYVVTVTITTTAARTFEVSRLITVRQL